jgi:hypothetical protein
MNVKIREVRDGGKLEKERVVLEVVAEDDIGYFLVCDSTYTADGKLSNKLRHIYWFPDKKVSPGDLVVLYTKGGQQSQKPFDIGVGTTHFFYWGLKETVWNKDGDCVVVLDCRLWTSKGVLGGS